MAVWPLVGLFSMLVSTAHASTGSAGLLPSAVPMTSGGAFAEINLDTVIGPDFAWSLAQVRGVYAASDRVVINAIGGTVLDYGLTTDEGLFAAWYPSLGVSYLVSDDESFRLAPFTQTAFNIYLADGGAHIAAAGLAMEGGGERIRGDLALPLVVASWAVESSDLELFIPIDSDGISSILLLVEGGVSYRLTEQDTLRLGKTTVLPYLMWT
ncbi:MAG: hypothetical protein QGG40_21360, partial [Myxococcota bacterium]|nr:hypothetical protein [Myxococcota bacterium]